MKVGDRVRQVSPHDYPTRMESIEAEITEIKEDGIVVRFYHFYRKEVVEQFWPSRWKVELMENK